MAVDQLQTLRQENSKLKDSQKLTQEMLNQRVLVEHFQKEIIDAGGRFFTTRELLDMTLEEILAMFSPNNIKFTAKYMGKAK